MFNFQGSELIIILLLALVVLGPEKLPEAMRRLGRFYADLKKMSTGFQDEFRAAVDEPTRELRDTANTLRDSLDFRKLADGERAEKPKSAEMASAEMAPAEPAPTGEQQGPAPTAPVDGTPVGEEQRPATPSPFSGDQKVSAAPPARRPTAAAPDRTSRPDLDPQIAVDDEHGLREARPADQDGAA